MRVMKEPDVRKQEILDGAIKIFTKKGYEKTTTSDIAKELNISQGLCYRYYPTKEAIYDAALDKYADFIVQGNIKKIGKNNSIKQLIEMLTDHHGKMQETEHENKEFFELFHTPKNQRMHKELFLKVAEKSVPFIQDCLRKAKENGEINISDTDAVSIVGIYGWIGLFMTENLTDKQRSEKMRFAWNQLLGL